MTHKNYHYLKVIIRTTLFKL